MHNLTTIILAAGEGKRMCSDKPKALHAMCGRTLLDRTLSILPETDTPPVAVVGFGEEKIKECYGDNLLYAKQEVPGSGGALMSAKAHMKSERVLVIACDLPLIQSETLAALPHIDSPAAFLSAELDDAVGYGRVIREGGIVKGIADAQDVTADTKFIREVRVSAYCFDTALLLNALDELETKDGFSMSDVINYFIRNSYHVDALPIPPEEAISVNDRVRLAQCASLMRERINMRHMLQGVTLIDPASAYIDDTVAIGRDCVIYPSVVLEGDTVIGERTTLYPACRIKDSAIGSDCVLQGVVANEAIVGDNVTAGPYVNLRPKAVISDNCRIGNYIEVKNSNVGEGTKLPHLSYIGDSDIGKRVNMGCGSVTVNYDGKVKHRTIIDDEAFIGCNSSLIAPVKVGKRAFIAAGSQITDDIPDSAFAIARARQVNKEGYMRREKS